jgi:hypothetical protein
LGTLLTRLTGSLHSVAERQSRLASLDLPYAYKGQAQLEKEIPQQYEVGKILLTKMGAKKAE